MESYLRDLAVAQRRRGDEVFVLAHVEGFGCAGRSEVVDGGVRLRRVRTFGQLLYAPVAPGFGFEMWRAIREFRPDVLHLHMPDTSAFWALWPCRVPMVVHWHSDVLAAASDRLLRPAYALYRHFEAALLRRADAVIATSAAYAEASRPLAPVMDKVHVVPLGLDEGRMRRVDAETVVAVRERYGVGEGQCLVAAVGRFAHYKGFHVLVEAATGLRDCVVVIVGDGPDRDGVARRVAELGLTGRVLLPGALPDADLHALFAACDVFCLPSLLRTEAFGVVLLEAMQYGRPLVCSDIPGSGVGFVNADGQTGLGVVPGDAAALRGALQRLVDDAALRERMGEAGRRRFAQMFRIDASAGGVANVYASVVRGAGARR
nr:glycosyltransferase [Desulfobaculum xiamenense]